MGTDTQQVSTHTNTHTHININYMLNPTFSVWAVQPPPVLRYQWKAPLTRQGSLAGRRPMFVTFPICAAATSTALTDRLPQVHLGENRAELYPSICPCCAAESHHSHACYNRRRGAMFLENDSVFGFVIQCVPAWRQSQSQQEFPNCLWEALTL